jgi:hypothetical protein
MAQRRRVAAGLAVLTVTAACAPVHERTTPPIRVGRPRISATRLTLPPPEANGLAQFRRWPKACDLLTADDMKAVLPQITKIVERPRAQEIRILNLDAVGDFDAPDSACEISFWVAGAERRKHGVPDVLRVDDVAVGDTATVKDNYDSLARVRGGVPADLGALECASDADSYFCRMPNIAFSVSAAPSFFIDRFDGQPRHTEPRAYWVHSVLPAFVRSIASKLPRR